MIVSLQDQLLYSATVSGLGSPLGRIPVEPEELLDSDLPFPIQETEEPEDTPPGMKKVQKQLV